MVVRKGLGMDHHSCQEGTKRHGEYHQHNVHCSTGPAWCEQDGEMVLCLVSTVDMEGLDLGGIGRVLSYRHFVLMSHSACFPLASVLSELP